MVEPQRSGYPFLFYRKCHAYLKDLEYQRKQIVRGVSIYLSSIYISIYLSIYLLYLSIDSIYSIYLSIYSIYSIYLYIYLFFLLYLLYLSIYSIYILLFLSIYSYLSTLYIYLSIYFSWDPVGPLHPGDLGGPGPLAGGRGSRGGRGGGRRNFGDAMRPPGWDHDNMYM